MNILHRSTTPALLDRLKTMIGGASATDIAVGYFFISGFSAVANQLAGVEKIRLLVGRTDRQVLEEIAQGIQQTDALRAQLDSEGLVRRSQRDRIAVQAISKIATGVATLDQTTESESSVQQLRDLITSGQIEVKTYPKGPLHAKAYLCWYPDQVVDGSAVIGSSNFTLAGFTGNTELNVEVSGQSEMSELKRWFDELWAESIDITDEIETELDRSWVLAKTPPYHVYLKALYELYGEEVGTETPIQRVGRELLANYQLDAVARALTMIDTYGGCYIGDVVGLGKTFIGAEILRQLRFQYPEDGEPLIICPAGLIPMWAREVERFGIGADVVSMSMIGPPPGLEFEEEEGRYVYAEDQQQGLFLNDRYPNRGPVLIDEAHNFRNRGGRYQGLEHYLGSGNHKVVMLSATPQNLGPRDIYRQLALYLDETNHGINIEPLGLEDFFRAAERWHRYRIEYENFESEENDWLLSGRKGTRPTPPSEPSVPRSDITDVLSPIFIRRRRRDIREIYGDTAEINGKPIQFPVPVLDNIEYRLDNVYAKAGSLDEITDLLKEHQGARYQATEYLDPEGLKQDPRYRDLVRAGDRVARLMRALLMKRLESSVAAFRSTLESLIRSNRNFKTALEDGFVPIGATATRMLAGETFDADELLEALVKEEERRQTLGLERSTMVHSTDDFDVERWIDDLDADFNVLSDLSHRVDPIAPEDDDKLQVLKKFVARKDVSAEKILIFSEAETTVEYLYKNLNPGGEDETIVRISGGAGSSENVVKRFAPKANLREKERMPGTEIRVLLATDVVSEGQNLQDCSRVLNYDLHWNPVRLVQRFGRVDRIGTDHDTIYLQNMWPDTEVDDELGLTDKLIGRIQMFHDFIGLDSKLLSESERLNTDAMYRIYKDKKLPEIDDGLDDVASHQLGVALLQRIQTDDPELWETIENLPDGIRSALVVQVPSSEQPIDDVEAERFAQAVQEIDGAQIPLISSAEQADLVSPFDDPRPGESIVLVKAGDLAEAYAVTQSLEVRRITAAQFVSAAECEPDTPAQSLPENTNERVMSAVAQFRADKSRRLGRARRRTDNRLVRYIRKELRLVLESLGDDVERVRQVELLRRIFLGPLPGPVESALQDVRKYSLSGDQLLARLEALRHRFRLNPPDEDEVAFEPDTEIVRIIGSDGLV